MADNDKEDTEEKDTENLREIILQQLANLEQSDISDDDSYKVRLSCILEDDESESSGTAAGATGHKQFPKDVDKESERTEESEKGPPPELSDVLMGVQLSESLCDSELSDDFTCENVQITDLDDVTLCDAMLEKTDEPEKTELEQGFPIKKLKSSDNVHKRPIVIRRRELSSDSSDLDISASNSAEGPSSDLKIVDITEGNDEATLNAATDTAYVESETSADEEPPVKSEPKPKGSQLEVVDNETLSEIFAKVSRTYLEKTRANVKWEENEKIERVFREALEERAKAGGKEQHPAEHLSFQDVHIRGTSPREYNPPVPPETYLWEELKRLRERGGYPWTYLDKPPFDEATWKKYMYPVARDYYNRRRGMKKSSLRRGRSSESLEKSPKEERRGRRREKSLSLTRDRKQSSRESSISSIGREVRCACQYFQSDSLLPERISLFGSRPPSRNSDMTKSIGEHVYEPINPPPLTTETKPSEPFRDEGGAAAAEKMTQLVGSTIPETDKKFVRIPSENGSTSAAKQSGDEAMTTEDLEVERISAAREFQQEMETRFSAETPTTTTATTASQSKTDVTSSILDTSGFEDLPLKQGSLVKTRREQMRAQAQEIQQKLRNHAGRIRNKFSTMQRPSLSRKDRGVEEKTGEKSRFRLPEVHAPRISLPDRSRFKLPEKAKFHLPESARIHLPDRSKLQEKFRIPEKAKFHLPDRSKFHLPERGRFHLPEKARFHLPDRSKFHLPDKAKFHLPERAKFNLPHRPKLELPHFRRSTGESSSQPPTKSRFDFDFKSYPKLFTKHSKEYTTSSPKQTRGRTPPPRMKQEELNAQKTSEKWMEKLDDLNYVDDDLDEGEIRETDSRKSEKSESLFDYPERELGYMEDFAKLPHEIRTLSTKSSTSRLSDKELQSSESSDDRKKGVLEEINSDEFFLRQKGISQDDIDMGQYLSREIREAFRSPDVNALAKMDYMDDENLPYQTEPRRPNRTGSGRKTKSILKKTSTSDPSIGDDGYKTYPPRRPGRKSRSQSKSLLNEDAIIAESSSRYETAEVDMSRYDNVDYDEDNISEYYKTPGPVKEYQHYKIPRSHAPVYPSPPVKRKSSLENEASSKRHHQGWEDIEHECELSEPPKPAARRKNRKKMAAKEEPDSMNLEQAPQEVIEDTEGIVPEPQPIESPIPPKRTRTRSSGSRSLRSFATEDDVSRSFHSEPGRDFMEHPEDEIITEHEIPVERSSLVKSASEFMTPRAHEYEITDLDDVGFGYATVGKPTVTKPERQKKMKPERPPPPRRRKEISVPAYNTYPRRPPVRPLRNYSTVGPSRPPRHRRISPIEQTLAERQFKTYAELESPRFDESLDLIEVSGSSKDLQTEKVIEKMKGRPLPPPPRPPRQKSKGPEDEFEQTEEEKLSISILRDEEFPLERQVTAFVHEPPIEREAVEEICASTQTDPLPDDFSFETEEGSEMIQEFSHEQLRIQQAFLEEMKREEEEMRERGKTNANDMVDAELKAEVIRQIEDIIAEEKRMMEEHKTQEMRRREESEPKKPERKYLDVDADMGYASLERRGHRQEQPQDTAPSETSPELPKKMEKLQIKELEVETLSVHEVQADQIFVKELQGNRISSQDIDNTGGNMVLGNVNLPPALVQQIVSKVPWDSLRHSQPTETTPAPPVRPQRRRPGTQQQDDSDDETQFQTRKTHRRHHHRPQYPSDEEDRTDRRQLVRYTEPPRDIPELSLQLVRACTSAGTRVLRNLIDANTSFARTMDREMCVQAVLCIAVALIAGFFLFGYDAKIVHLHRWDFQFPPQPPHGGH